MIILEVAAFQYNYSWKSHKKDFYHRKNLYLHLMQNVLLVSKLAASAFGLNVDRELFPDFRYKDFDLQTL